MKSKRYKRAESFLQNQKVYTFEEALKILRESGSKKMNQVKISFFLNNKSKTQASFRDFFKIPHIVKETKIAVVESDFSSSFKDKLENVLFLNLDQLEKVTSFRNKKKWGFDKLFADNSTLPLIKNFARKLSSKKCFPNAKEGTIMKSEKDVLEYLNGKTEIRSDRDGNFNLLLGKTSLKDSDIKENYESILSKVRSLKPSNWKGDYLKSITLSNSMGPGIRVSIR